MHKKTKGKTRLPNNKNLQDIYLPWRLKQNKWTDTIVEQRFLNNPSLMTNTELARALQEHYHWRKGFGKYQWEEDPIKEKAETEPPFSEEVLSKLLTETIGRLKMIGDMTEGRFKEEW